MTIRLHGFPGTRTNRVRWMLEELGVDYEFVLVEILKGAHKEAGYLERHPHGRVPYFEDGEVKLLESCAAVLHLADSHPEKKLAPALGTAERAAYYQWIVYSAATLDEPVIKTYFHTVIFPPERRKQEVVDEHRPTLQAACRVLDAALAGKSHLLGDAFSAADVAVGYALNLMDQANAIQDAPHVAAYLARLRERPSFKKVYG